MANKTLQEQADEILARAKQKGLETDFFFRTTFKRYQVQMQVLAQLEKEIKDEGATVSKEYVKGRKNLYINPAISAYNSTAAAANQTVSTLISIVDRLSGEEERDVAPQSVEIIRAKFGLSEPAAKSPTKTSVKAGAKTGGKTGGKKKK